MAAAYRVRLAAIRLATIRLTAIRLTARRKRAVCCLLRRSIQGMQYSRDAVLEGCSTQGVFLGMDSAYMCVLYGCVCQRRYLII